MTTTAAKIMQYKMKVTGKIYHLKFHHGRYWQKQEFLLSYSQRSVIQTCFFMLKMM